MGGVASTARQLVVNFFFVKHRWLSQQIAGDLGNHSFSQELKESRMKWREVFTSTKARPLARLLLVVKTRATIDPTSYFVHPCGQCGGGDGKHIVEDKPTRFAELLDVLLVELAHVTALAVGLGQRPVRSFPISMSVIVRSSDC